MAHLRRGFISINIKAKRTAKSIELFVSQALLVMCPDGESNCGRVIYACTCARTRPVFVSDSEAINEHSSIARSGRIILHCVSISVHIAIGLIICSYVPQYRLVIKARDIFKRAAIYFVSPYELYLLLFTSHVYLISC